MCENRKLNYKLACYRAKQAAENNLPAIWRIISEFDLKLASNLNEM